MLLRAVLGKQEQRGVTLIEVVVTVALLGFGVSAVLGLFSANLRTSQSNREYAAFVLLVTDIMERLRALPFASDQEPNITELAEHLSSHQYSLPSFYSYIGATIPPDPVLEVIPGVFESDANGNPYSVLRLLPEDSGAEIYVAEVEARWKEGMSPVRVVTRISKGGINDLLQPE